MRVRKSLGHAERGHELLERKRQILVMELMGKLEAARRAQEEAQQAMARAFEALRAAALAHGAERLFREGCGIPASHRMNVRIRSVMGVSVPEISFECDERELPFGLLSGASGADNVRKGFHDAARAVLDLAAVENAVMRLAREVKRTQRRVHALENIFIPDYQEMLKFIGDSLQEREREDLVIMKKVKRMRQPLQQTPY
jgi:V/A-type H+-transporting ATPase subunit D